MPPCCKADGYAISCVHIREQLLHVYRRYTSCLAGIGVVLFFNDDLCDALGTRIDRKDEAAAGVHYIHATGFEKVFF